MHYNIQVHVQQVREPEVMKDDKGYQVKGIGGAPIFTERQVTKLLDLSITADSEEEAYAKAHRLLRANAPELAAVRSSEPLHPIKGTFAESAQRRTAVRDNPQA